MGQSLIDNWYKHHGQRQNSVADFSGGQLRHAGGAVLLNFNDGCGSGQISVFGKTYPIVRAEMGGSLSSTQSKLGTFDNDPSGYSIYFYTDYDATRQTSGNFYGVSFMGPPSHTTSLSSSGTFIEDWNAKYYILGNSNFAHHDTNDKGSYVWDETSTISGSNITITGTIR